jgi:hypothetical protein
LRQGGIREFLSEKEKSKTQKDVEFEIDQVERNIKIIKRMMKRATQGAKENFDKWILEKEERLRILKLSLLN